MNERNFTQRFQKLLPLLIFIFGVQFGSAQIVGYDLKSGNAATAGIASNYPSQGKIMNISGITSNGYSTTNGQTCYKWLNVGSDCWVTSSFSTGGYISLTGSFQMKATSTGPRDFKIQYSTDGSTWFNASGYGTYTNSDGTLVLTTGLLTYNFSLPQVCENKATVYVRLVLNSLLNLNNVAIGTSSSSKSASLLGVSIAGNAFSAPSTQASIISIISVTPTTIKIGCTTGNGNRRLIKINTINSFTDPVDNQNISGNTTYGGSGEQIIYNGAGTSITVNIPSSKNQYWFRIYDYNIMDALTRYNTLTANGNPKLCKLENIHSPTSTSVQLVNVVLGATIDLPSTGTIVERGIFWSTTSPVDETSNLQSQISSSGGVYSIPVLGVDRGTTIYYKGYVTNESGTIMSEESSFSNIPVFSGTGTWETPSLWNVQEVPGANGDLTDGDQADSPIIDGNCTLTSSNSVTDLTINSGKSLTISTGPINAGNILNVAGTITNNAGNSGIVIKSANNLANGSLIWTNGNPSGTVEMYSKSYTDTRYHWQYFGIPVTGMTAGSAFSGNGVRVRRYNEANIDPTGNDVGLWLPSAAGATMATTNDPMSPVIGYEVTQPTAGKFIFTGTLNHSNITNYALGYTSGADWQGSNIIANPFTAAITIASLSSTGTDGNVYLYNAGSRDEWTSNSGATADGTSPGQYVASNGTYAGNLGTPEQIPSMQGFLVNAIAANPTITIPYGSIMANNTEQRVKAATPAIVGTRIDVSGANYSDKMWIFTDQACTRKFDTGYDGPKMLGSSLTPQLFSMEEDGNYQIDAVDDMNNTFLGFQAGSETNLKLVFTHQNLDLKYANVYLVDLLENKTVDVTASGTEYAFTAASTPLPTKRFQVITTPTSSTAIINTNADAKLKVFSSQGNVFVQNLSGKVGNIVLFNIAGAAVCNAPFKANGITTFSNLSPGIYISRAKSDNVEVKNQLIIR